MVITDAGNFKQVPYEIALSTPTVIEENEKIYLIDGDLKLDITEDARDGSAAGTYEKDGLNYEYKAEAKEETWEVSLSEKFGSRKDRVSLQYMW